MTLKALYPVNQGPGKDYPSDIWRRFITFIYSQSGLGGFTEFTDAGIENNATDGSIYLSDKASLTLNTTTWLADSGGAKVLGSVDTNIVSFNTVPPYGVGFDTGTVLLTYGSAPDGWLIMDDSTIGQTGSNATHTGETYRGLFQLLWQNCSDAICTVSSGRGITASADFNNLKTIALSPVLGRILCQTTVGKPTGFTDGEETHLITVDEMANHGHTYPRINATVSPSSTVRQNYGNAGLVSWGANFLTTTSNPQPEAQVARSELMQTQYSYYMVKL